MMLKEGNPLSISSSMWDSALVGRVFAVLAVKWNDDPLKLSYASAWRVAIETPPINDGTQM